jgi:guanylate kinase
MAIAEEGGLGEADTGKVTASLEAVAALQAATEAGDFDSLKAATDAWKEHCKPVAPTGPAFEAAASKLAVLKAERDSRGWKYPPQLSPSSTRRSLSPQKSGALASSAEHSATVVATLEARKSALKTGGALPYDSWVGEKKRQHRERTDYYRMLADEEARARREERMRNAERALQLLELERGWPSRTFEAMPTPGAYAASPELMRYAKMKYTRVNGRSRSSSPSRRDADLSPYASSVAVLGRTEEKRAAPAPAAAPAAAPEAPAPPAPITLSKPAIVVCGPSGVGKGTLIGKLMAEHGDKFGFSVSHTTRAPREGEENGVHYHFAEHAAIEADIAAGKFLESAHVHGNIYGTSLAAVAAVGDSGKLAVLDIDVQGAEKVKASPIAGSAFYVFVAPPSMEDLEGRLRGRGTETEEKIAMRLANAGAEMAKSQEAGFFNAVIVNGELEAAYAELKRVIEELAPGTFGDAAAAAEAPAEAEAAAPPAEDAPVE